MASMDKLTHRVLVLLFTNVDVLDYAGPLEVLGHASYNRNPEAPEPVFDIRLTAKGDLVPTGHGNLVVSPTMTITEALLQLDQFHILVVPGGPPNVIQALLDSDQNGSGSQELELIKAFGGLRSPVTGTHPERVLFSVCTGAFFLANAGLLADIDCTTHHRALELLPTVCPPGKEPRSVQRHRRYVDAGVVGQCLKIVTAGGISSGLDAALHVVRLYSGQETADFIGRVMEYELRQEH